MKRWYRFFLLPLAMFWQIETFAGPPDSAVAENPISVRSFDPEKLNNLRNDSEFNYDVSQMERESLWSKFIKLFFQYLDWIFRKVFNIDAPAISKWIIVSVIAVLAVYLILHLMNISLKDTFFTPGDSGNLAYKVEEENIHALDFNRLIDESIRRSEYRTAIRYLYLFSLKKLSDRHLIDWVPGKTNREYEIELQQKQVGNYFSQLGYYFEYAWYGEFELSSESFKKAQNIFLGLEEAMGK